MFKQYVLTECYYRLLMNQIRKFLRLLGQCLVETDPSTSSWEACKKHLAAISYMYGWRIYETTAICFTLRRHHSHLLLTAELLLPKLFLKVHIAVAASSCTSALSSALQTSRRRCRRTLPVRARRREQGRSRLKKHLYLYKNVTYSSIYNK